MHQLLQFEGYTLDLTRGCLRAGNRMVELRPKSFGVLAYLVENAGRLVSKDEIMAAVWPDVIASDESLAKCVSEVRAALGDSDQRLVRTVPRRGYLLDVPVSPGNGALGAAPLAAASSGKAPAEAAASLRPAAAARSRLVPLAAAALLALLAGSAAVFAWRGAYAPSPPDRASIAVLPFANAGGDTNQEYFSDGLTEDLIAGLGRFSSLFVIGRISVFAYKGRHVSAEQVGRELGVRYLLEGSVRHDGERLRITSELIDAATGAQLWAESYDRAATRIFAVQDEVTRKIVATLVAHVDRSELARVLRKRAASFTAYDDYLRGKALLTMRHGDNRGEMVARARQFFSEALAADPRYAPALQGLAYTYAAAFLEPMRDGMFGGELRQQATLDRALSLAQQAVEVDPYLAEAHATLAWTLHWQYRRGDALAEFERALALNPNLSDGRLAHMLAHDGRASEAVAYMQRVMRQDPFPPPIYLSYLGNAYYLTGQYDDAVEALQNGAARLPGYRAITVWLAAAAAQSGRDELARQAASAVLATAPDFTIRHWLSHIRFDRGADADRLAEGLRKAGLPE
jgi:adenylate cyclase